MDEKTNNQVFPLSRKSIIEVLLDRRKPLSYEFLTRLESHNAEDFKKIYVEYLKDSLYENLLEEKERRKGK